MTNTIAASGASARKVIGLMIGLSVISYLDRTVMSIAGPRLISEFQLSETEMGTIFSAFILSYAVLMVPGGWLADRFGPRVVLAWASAGTALFTALTALAGQPALVAVFGVLPSFLILRFGLGVFASPLYPACARMTANWVPVARRARVQGFIIAGAPLGAAISPVLFAWLIAAYGWRASFVAAAVATAVVALLWLFLVRDYPEGGPAGDRQEGAVAASPGGGFGAWWKVLRNRNVVLLTLGYFAINYFEYIFFYWIYYYFGTVRNLGASQSAVYTTTLLLVMMVMMPLGGWISDRLVPRFGPQPSRRFVAVGGMALSALLLYLGTSVGHELVMVALLSLALGCAASSEGPYWAAAIEAAGSENAGAAGGIMNGVGNIGGLLAPVLTPMIAAWAGWSVSLYFASALILAGALSWFFMSSVLARSEQALPANAQS